MFEERFIYYPPDESEVKLYEHVRRLAAGFAEWVGRNCPDTRERALAITKIEEAVMWANASIARNARG